QQAETVQMLLTGRAAALIVEIVPIETSADLWPGDLAQLGGKGNFTMEIDRALLAGGIDVGVHCMKDVPGDVPLPAGTEFGAYLTRGDVHDLIVTSDGRTLDELPAGAKVGTSSVRRRAQLALFRPDLITERVRGNVTTRLAKLDKGEYDALILARAGLKRLALEDRITQVLPVDFVEGSRLAMVPAIGAGVIGIQARCADAAVMRLLEEFNDPATARHVLAERTMLHMLRGHCNSPIAGHATTTADGQLSLFGMVFNRDGSAWVRSHAWGPVDDPASLGDRVAADLLRQGARQLIAATSK
ncbi:MAG: hydroxymethylbilane synthase, partial [Sporichthyaceae bacterium]|nr:hydroxymethylbilane synthase [Sporichthyaceae bacterium]